MLALRGRLRARTGGSGQADLRRARELYASVGESAEAADTGARIADRLLMSGDAAGAKLLVDDAGDDPLLLRVRGLALLALGEHDAARTTLSAAVEAAATAGVRHESAYALHALVLWHVATGVQVPADVTARLAAAQAELGIVRIATPVGLPAG